MYKCFVNLIVLVISVLQISTCRQILSNNVNSYSEEQAPVGLPMDDREFVEPVIVNIDFDNYGDGVYIYRNIPANISLDQSDDMRRCSGGSCKQSKRPERPKRPASKDYPTMMNCRGILQYCRKECIDLNVRMCGDWPYMCPNNTVPEIADRCRIQCIHNYRQMRIKFPNQPKLPSRFVDPRYDRFDYE